MLLARRSANFRNGHNSYFFPKGRSGALCRVTAPGLLESRWVEKVGLPSPLPTAGVFVIARKFLENKVISLLPNCFLLKSLSPRDEGSDQFENFSRGIDCSVAAT